MLRKMLSMVILCLLVSGCVSDKSSNLSSKPVSLSEKEQPSKEFIPITLKVVALGDSLTKGVGDETNRGGYIGMLKDELEQQEEIKEVQLDNFGIKGHKTSNLLKRLNEEKVINSIKQANMIVLTIGGNDLMKVVRNNIFTLDYAPFRKEQKNYQRNLEDIFSTIRQYNNTAEIVLIGLYNPFKYMLPELTEIDTIISEWNTVLKQMIENDKHGIFVSVEDLFLSTSEERLLSEDEFHPNSKGYSLIADRVFEVLQKNEQFLETP